MVERQVAKRDLEDLDPSHWIMEFPKVWEENGFDIIIGNPPHGNILKDIEKEIISSRYPWGTMNSENNLKGSNNAGTIFSERCYSFESSPNRLGFVLPSSIARVEKYEKFRSYVRKKLERIGEIGIAFKNVGLEQIIIFLHDAKNSSQIQVFNYRGKTFEESKIPKDLYKERDIFLTRLDQKKYKVLTRIEEGTSKLFDFVPEEYEMPRGITVRSSKYSDEPSGGRVQVLGGINVFPFGLKSGKKRKSNRYLNENHSALKDYKSKFPKGRIIYQNVVSSDPHIVSTYLPFQLPTDDTLNNLVLDDMPTKPLVTILNSKLMTFYLNFGIINCSRLTVHLDSPYLGKIPVAEFNQSVFARLTDILLFLQQTSKGDIWPNTVLSEKSGELFAFFEELANLVTYEAYIGQYTKSDKSLTNSLENYLEEIEYNKYMNEIFASRRKKGKKKVLQSLQKNIIEKITEIKTRISGNDEICTIKETLLEDEMIQLVEKGLREIT